MDSREQPLWVFRHIGPPSSIPESVEIVELKQGATTFGRGATADVYIDSLVLRNFISRRHAVVVGERDQDGQLQFILHDHGLNGTYVNDMRMGEVQRLQEGDKVTFGHKNGYKVQVGETAEQSDSEFQFVLEQCEPGKLGITPLQEHRQQEGTKGAMCMSDTNHQESPGTVNVRPGQTNHQHRGGSMQKRNETDQGHVHENLSKSPSHISSENQRSKSPSYVSSENQRSKSPRTEDSDVTGTKFKMFTGKGSPRIKETGSAKENKQAKARGKPQEGDGATVPRRRYSDEGVTESKKYSKRKPSRQLPLNASCRRSVSPKPTLSPNSRSKHPRSEKAMSHQRSKRIEPLFACTFSGSPKHVTCSQLRKDTSRSGSSSSDDSEYNSLTRGESAANGSAPPGHVSSDNRSVSPGLVRGDNYRASPCHRSLPNRTRSKSPTECDSRSRASSPGNERSSSVYDEPPVLTPEYVRTPSSVIRTPSPPNDVNKDEDIFDEMDFCDRDSLVLNIPRTPGHDFHGLSPCSPSSRLDISPQQKSTGVSPDSECATALSDQKDGSDIKRNKQKSLQKNHERSPAIIHKAHHFNRYEVSVPEHERETCSQKTKSESRWSQPVEPDSTTSIKDSKDHHSDLAEFRKIESRGPEDCQGRKSNPSDAAKRSGNLHCKSSEDSTVKRNRRSQMKGTDKGFLTETADRNVFDELSAYSNQLGQLSTRKRPCSTNSDGIVNGDDAAELEPKSSRLNGKSDRYFGEKKKEQISRQRSLGEAGKSKEKQLSNEQILKDVRVCVQRVSCKSETSAKSNFQESNRQTKQHASVTSSGGHCTGPNRLKQMKNVTKGTRPSQKANKECKDSPDISLFGLEMERLNTMQIKERTRVAKDKAQGKKDKCVPTDTSNSTEFEKGKGKRLDKLSSLNSCEKPKSTSPEKLRQRRAQRTLKSGSQTSDKCSSDEEIGKIRSLRKIALRRPRQTTDDDKRLHVKDVEQDERKPNRPSKRRKRTKRKAESDEDEEEGEYECLEEGVTWYEEDTCASSYCHRPSDRRVQWVCCDDCDSWYHTVCVGIFLEDLKEDEDYHCGTSDDNVRERLPYGKCIRCTGCCIKKGKNPLKFGVGPSMWRDIESSPKCNHLTSLEQHILVWCGEMFCTSIHTPF